MDISLIALFVVPFLSKYPVTSSIPFYSVAKAEYNLISFQVEKRNLRYLKIEKSDDIKMPFDTIITFDII